MTKEECKKYRKAWKKANPDKVKAYYISHKDERDAESKAYYYSHKEQRNAKSKAYYASHPEKFETYRRVNLEKAKAYNKAYRKAHPEKAKAGKNKYRANHPDSYDYPDEFNETLKDKIRSRDQYSCRLCNEHWRTGEPAFHVHHIDHIKKHCDPQNLITLCVSCHRIVHSKNNIEKNIKLIINLINPFS